LDFAAFFALGRLPFAARPLRAGYGIRFRAALEAWPWASGIPRPLHVDLDVAGALLDGVARPIAAG